MAIAVDTTEITPYSSATSAVSISMNYDVGTGSDRFLMAMCIVQAGSPGQPSTRTYNSVAMSVSWNNTTGYLGNYGFHLANPASGDNLLSMSGFGATEDFIMLGGIAATGVDGTTPVGTSNTATGSGESSTVDVSSAADEIVIGGQCIEGTSGQTGGAGQTDIWNQTAGGYLAGVQGWEAGSATVSHSYTWSGNVNFILGAIPVKPVSGGGGGAIPVVGRPLGAPDPLGGMVR